MMSNGLWVTVFFLRECVWAIWWQWCISRAFLRSLLPKFSPSHYLDSQLYFTSRGLSKRWKELDPFVVYLFAFLYQIKMMKWKEHMWWTPLTTSKVLLKSLKSLKSLCHTIHWGNQTSTHLCFTFPKAWILKSSINNPTPNYHTNIFLLKKNFWIKSVWSPILNFIQKINCQK